MVDSSVSATSAAWAGEDVNDPKSWLYIIKITMIPINIKYLSISEKLDKDSGRNKKINSTREKAASALVKVGRLFIVDIIQKSPSLKLPSLDGD